MKINQKAINDIIFDNVHVHLILYGMFDTEFEAVECNKGKSLSNQLGKNKRLNS